MEAHELRDESKEFDGKGVTQAVSNVNSYGVSMNIIDFNVCKETFSEIQKTEEDSFNNLQNYFSINVSTMKSRYVDTLTELNRFETSFYATNDLEKIINVPQFLDGLCIEMNIYM